MCSDIHKQVGYKKPPKANQFQKGRSGNPSGRPREIAGIAELLAKVSRVDLVIVEGFKREPHRKIEVHRLANNKPLLFPEDLNIAGIATDAAIETTLPVVHLDDVEAVAGLMQRSAMPVADVLATRANKA